MSTLFIADLHLDESRPAATQAFLTFLDARATKADALYILGDLFEAWIGDDDDAPLPQAIAAALSALQIPKFYLHGNRDFLLGQKFAKRCGMTILPDPTVIDLYGVPTVVMHGDLLCTDDVQYQAFRQQVRDPQWQQMFLSQPLAARRAFAAQARNASAEHQAGLSNMETITDVTADAVESQVKTAGVRQLIHGHTHRPAIHRAATHDRIVVGDWYEQGSVLVVEPDGTRTLESLPYTA